MNGERKSIFIFIKIQHASKLKNRASFFMAGSEEKLMILESCSYQQGTRLAKVFS